MKTLSKPGINLTNLKFVKEGVYEKYFKFCIVTNLNQIILK